MTEYTEEDSINSGRKFSNTLNKIENIYLLLLRTSVLLFATGLLIYSGYALITGVWKVSKSPDSVVMDKVAVSGAELAKLETTAPSPATRKDQDQVLSPEQEKFYTDFVKRYHALYRTKFEPFRQPEDKQLDRDEFDDAFVQSPNRMKAISNFDKAFEDDRASLEGLLAAMTEAAATPEIQTKLNAYKTAKKVRVERQVRRVRTEHRRGWNSYSTDCAGWFYSPIGCPEIRSVEVPYTATETAMEFPKGTQSHTELFKALQARYFAMMEERQSAAELKLASEKTEIAADNEEGAQSISTALKLGAGFILLMFFFLLIAIERHQRRIAQELLPKPAADPAA